MANSFNINQLDRSVVHLSFKKSINPHFNKPSEYCDRLKRKVMPITSLWGLIIFI